LETSQIIIGVAIVLLILFIFKSKSKEPTRRPPSANLRTNRGRIEPGTRTPREYSDGPNPDDLIKSGRIDQAVNIYKSRNQHFLAARAIASKGPQEAMNVLTYIQENIPDRTELMINNLVEDFYHRERKPAIAAVLYRAIGKTEEAEAIEIASNITSTARFVTIDPAPISNEPPTPIEYRYQRTDDQRIEDHRPEPPTSTLKTSETTTSITPTINTSINTEEKRPDRTPNVKRKVSNQMLVATRNSGENCLVCKREITSGQTYLFCLHCGRIAHTKHLLEYSRIKGTCPNCNERISASNYDLTN
jgi:hypothetical protein